MTHSPATSAHEPGEYHIYIGPDDELIAVTSTPTTHDFIWHHIGSVLPHRHPTKALSFLAHTGSFNIQDLKSALETFNHIDND